MFIFFTLFSLFARSYWHTSVQINTHFLMIEGTICAFAGALWGLSVWRSLKRRFYLP
jgi:hypothetical protein